MKSDRSISSNVAETLIDWSRVKRVLLIRLRSIGDTVLMTPCLQALNDWKPSVEISVVSEESAASILEGHPLIYQLFVTGKELTARLSLVSRLRRRAFDLAFNLHGGTTAMFMTAMSGAKHTFGFRGQRASWLLNNRAPGPDRLLKRETVHSVEQQLALLNFAGVPIPEQPRLRLSIDPGASARARAKLIAAGLTAASLASERFAIVAAGAAFESKRWGTRGFAAVVDHLHSRWKLKSVIIAGPGQERLAAEVAGFSNSNPYVLCEISIAELKAVVGTFGRVFVGNDSGPMHVAAALECPVVAVFGSSNPDVWRPWTSAPCRVLGGERGTPDSNVRGSIGRVEADEVIAAVDEVLAVAATHAAS